jgi:hypothetical protein
MRFWAWVRSLFVTMTPTPSAAPIAPNGLPLFSSAALAVLDRQSYDPAAKGFYEIMSGGLLWPDELPELGTAAWKSVEPDCVYRYLIAYRASITLGEERPEFRPVWDQVAKGAQNWPGLREERRSEKARKRLLAAKRGEARCLDNLDSQVQTECRPTSRSS